jgi:hypothetical protein
MKEVNLGWVTGELKMIKRAQFSDIATHWSHRTLASLMNQPCSRHLDGCLFIMLTLDDL